MLTDLTAHTRAQDILGHAYICCQQVQDLSKYIKTGLLSFGTFLIVFCVCVYFGCQFELVLMIHT